MAFDPESVKKTESYGPAALQSLDVYRVTQNPSALWLIFIHGGAWRDPKVTSQHGHQLLSSLLSSSPTRNAASLNYRLSPHPNHPDLHDTNTAKHPDHIHDVLAALQHLQTTHALQNYVLIGHSAGAMLSLQTLSLPLRPQSLPPAKLVVALEGIYHLPALVQEYPAYRAFVAGAFGEDDKVWEEASPAVTGLPKEWKGVVVLAQSDEDELLSWAQTEAMKERLEERDSGMVRVVKVQGKHMEVPTAGTTVRAVERYLGLVE